MKIHHLRNATFVIETEDQHILVDPMLGPLGSLPPFAFFAHRPRRNPLVDLPGKAAGILDRVSLCLVTHAQKWGVEALTHTDHLDSAGRAFLRDRRIAVVCPAGDAVYMERRQIFVAAAPGHWQRLAVAGGHVTAVPARHGHSWIHRFMANGAGFFLELPGTPTLYISGDTVLTSHVTRALAELKPEIAVVAAGGAGLDLGGRILMSLDEILAFVQTAPGRVVANHLGALNHCPISREQLKTALKAKGLLSKCLIPDDGETLVF